MLHGLKIFVFTAVLFNKARWITGAPKLSGTGGSIVGTSAVFVFHLQTHSELQLNEPNLRWNNIYKKMDIINTLLK